MQKTTFKISKMDCPSEEQMIRMKLADLTNINSLDFDIPNRLLTVFHTDNHDQIFQRLDNLKFDTSLIDSISADNYEVTTNNTDKERKLLWQVLAINFFFFAANTGLAKVAVQCSADTFVVNQSLVLRINICGENRHLRQARNR
jgi:cation transport ATPase